MKHRWANQRDRMSLTNWLENLPPGVRARYETDAGLSLILTFRTGEAFTQRIPITELWNLKALGAGGGWRAVVARELTRMRYRHRQQTPPPPHRCKYCGAPSWVDPSDQLPPRDFCHFGDHGP